VYNSAVRSEYMPDTCMGITEEGKLLLEAVGIAIPPGTRMQDMVPITTALKIPSIQLAVEDLAVRCMTRRKVTIR